MGNPIAQQCPPTRKPTDRVKVNLYAVGLLCCVCCCFFWFGQVGDSRLGWGRSSDLERILDALVVEKEDPDIIERKLFFACY